MGVKGDKESSKGNNAIVALMEKLNSIEGLTYKKMFGGFGLFHESRMFGIVNSKGDSYFKVNEQTKQSYLKANSEQHSKMPYFTIPIEVLNNQDLLNKWAKESIEISKK